MNHKNPFRAILAVLLAFELAAFVTIGSVPVAVFATALDTGTEDSGADNGNEDGADTDDDIPSDAEDATDDDSSDAESAADDDEAGDETGETDAELLIDRIGDLEPISDGGDAEDGEGDATADIAENADMDWQDSFSLEDITDENDGIDDGEDTEENTDTDDTDEDIADADSDLDEEDDSDLDDEEDDDTDSETVTVRMQSGHDFADRDEFGVWRDADGSVASNEFRRYVGVNGDGVLLFTADEDGDITYEEEKKLYFDAEKNAFFSDEDRTLPLTGLYGLLSSAELETDAETALAMLEISEESAVAVEVSGEDIYPKLLFDRLTGKQLTKEEIAEQGLPADRIEERNPEEQMYLIWKLTESDATYAPEFASYVCASMEGNILFFADGGGCIYQDISEHALYNENYFFTFGGTDGQDGKDGKLITRYGDLGLAHYPAAGEAVRFTVDGEAFELTLLDKGEGAKGRYLCRRITEEILGEDDSEDADEDWESDATEDFEDETDDTDDGEGTDADEYAWNPDKLMDDETVVLVMDANGNICYAADGFEWQFVDYGLDYAQLGRMVAAGRNITDEDDIDDPEDAVLEEEEEPVVEEDGDEPDDEADDPIGSGEDETGDEDDSDEEVEEDDFKEDESREEHQEDEKQVKEEEPDEKDDADGSEDVSEEESEGDSDTDLEDGEDEEMDEPEDDEEDEPEESEQDSFEGDNGE